VALFAITATLVTVPQAVAKHGRGGDERGGEGSDEGHDRGRHLGWYKHGGPVYVDPAPYASLPYSRYAPAYPPVYTGEWVGRRAWGGGAYAWQSAAIAAAASWGIAWGLGSSFAYFAPPVVFVPEPDMIELPPLVGAVPWLDAPAPYEEVRTGYLSTPEAAPEALLAAALPPPLVMLPPRSVVIGAAPPPLIFSPPDYAMSVWPVLAFAPPLLAVAVLHDEWWSGRYEGRGGYYSGAYYASSGYANGWYSDSSLYTASAVAVAGVAGAAYSRRRESYGIQLPLIGFVPGPGRLFGGHGRGEGRGEGHEGHGEGHGHGR